MLKPIAVAARILVILALLLAGRSAPAVSAADFDCSTVTDVSIPECEALVALYLSAGGANWVHNENWLSANQISWWWGVNVTDGHVTLLAQNNNNMIGTLPTELGSLTYVTQIHMGGNQLTGPLPASIGNMSSLIGLYLWGNQLTGSVPASFANLTNLESLILGGNNLSGPLPTSITGLTHLKDLALGDNSFEGSIPSDYGNITTLQSLEIRSNHLTGSIPSSFGNLTNLIGLHLADNQLTGAIPASIGNLTQLKELELQVNQLSGDIPATFWNLTNLEVISLRGNHLTGGIPSQLGNLTKLTSVDLRFNSFSGTIPTTVGNLTQLRIIELTFNNFTGTIPPQLGSLTNLNILNLDWNQLSGPVPDQLANLTNLYPRDYGEWHVNGLSLDYNRLTVPNPYPADPPTALHSLLIEKNPDWYLTQAVEETISPSGGEITSTDGLSTITIPPNAVIETTTIAYVPQEAPFYIPDDLIFVNKGFQIQALDEQGNPLDSFTFAKPVTITMQYNDTDVEGLDESRLILFYWDDPTSMWKDASTTCSPRSTYQREPASNTIAVQVCHLTEFGLFVDPPNMMYLPFTSR